MKEKFLKVVKNLKQFLENIKIVSSISILLLSFSVFYFLTILPNKKINIVTNFELRQSAELSTCMSEAKARYDLVMIFNCKSQDQKQKEDGVCSAPLHIQTRSEEVYKEDRELCINLYKTKLNIF